MSQWILDGEPEMDLSFIDVARFGDWTTREFARERTYEVFPRRYEIIYPQAERETGRKLRITPIYDELIAHGAVMGQAYGWERPLWFAPDGVEARDEPAFERPNWWPHVGEECRAVAEAVGLIEMSSYAKFIVEGTDAARFLDYVGSAQVPDINGKMALSLLLNARGGIVGDVTICRLDQNRFYLIGATLGEGILRRWLETRAREFDVTVRIVTSEYAVLGVAGPKSRALLQTLSDTDFSSPAFPFMSMQDTRIGRVTCRALRVSYSGELGWELHCPMPDQPDLFRTLFERGREFGLRLVGSRALGNLRLEKGYRSWGAEMTTEVSPHAAALERFCSRGKTYLGSEAVDAERESPPAKSLATLVVTTDHADCWGSEPVLLDDQVVGYVTSGGYGWRTGKSLAVAWLDTHLAKPGSGLQVQILEELYPAEVVSDPLYDPDNAKLRG